ncbi:YdcF family protein [Wenzhouxiangella sp. XN79A]|uniref:YdcF family protein n=1 Tax=Wenzhouxiangella sp. XN79A TaxID=2724193 RepID=UPI00144AB183|nr:YdcF family protein [Wenzhouxiangella sp. XN79A]NKI34266.1 YdcF family protein [Wenzhouxiangella sp. XN79A]
MGDFVEKVGQALVLPPGGLIVLALLGLWLAWRDRRGGKAIVFVALATLWLMATPAVSDALRGHLESMHPPIAIERVPEADAIVVLGGGIAPPTSRNPQPDLGAAADRYWHAFRLWRAGKAPEILISGGAQPWRDAGSSEAEAAVRLLTDLGMPADRILLEPASLDTRQNADFSATMLRARGADRILLVTSALHMRRASAHFESTGLEVLTVPTDHEVRGDPPSLLRWLPDSDALDGSRRALKEMLGHRLRR